MKKVILPLVLFVLQAGGAEINTINGTYGDMTFADYFAEIKQLVAELAQSTDLERSRAARNKEEQRTR